MALVDWREDFRIGIPEVDHEHQELIAIINRVHERMSKPGSDVSIADYLGEIYARIAAHFALEENLMRVRGYDQFAAHKMDHERLLDEIRDIMDDYEDRRLYDESQLAMRLEHWFIGHFRTHDARLHRNLPH